MSETNHTPGPWHVVSDGSSTKGAMDHTLYSKKKYLGTLCEGADDADLQSRGWLPNAEAEANARLVAAAPDLLETLKEAVALIPLGAVKRAAFVERASQMIARIEGR